MSVCRVAFCRAYLISHHVLDRISAFYKSGYVTRDSALSDSTSTTYQFEFKTIDDIKRLCKQHKLNLSLEQMQLAIIANTMPTKLMFFWMALYFNDNGDHIPNSYDEIHFDPVDKRELWAEYIDDINVDFPDEETLCYAEFCRMWRDVFPNVKIREYKQVFLLFINQHFFNFLNFFNIYRLLVSAWFAHC